MRELVRTKKKLEFLIENKYLEELSRCGIHYKRYAKKYFDYLKMNEYFKDFIHDFDEKELENLIGIEKLQIVEQLCGLKEPHLLRMVLILA